MASRNDLLTVRGISAASPKQEKPKTVKKGDGKVSISSNARNARRLSRKTTFRQSRGTKLKTQQRKAFVKKLQRRKSLKSDAVEPPEEVKPTMETVSSDISARIGEFTQDPEAQRRRLRAEFHTVQMRDEETCSMETPNLNLEEFTKLLNLLQVNIKDKELIEQLFHKSDRNEDNQVSLDEFIDTFLPNNRSRMRKRKRKKKKNFVCHRLENYPECLKQVQPKSVESLHFLLRDKIMKTVSRDSDLFRQVFLAFQAQRGENIQEQGIDFEGFSRVLENFGIFINEKVCREFFHRFDIDGNGTITLHEFVTGIMPHDYPSNSALAPVNHYGENEKCVEREDHHVRTLPATLRSFRWTIDQLNMHVQNKISERVSRDSDRFRQVFSIFEAQRGGDVHSQGIGPEGLARLLLDFGIILADKQLLEWFDKLDMDGDGTVSLYEFMQATMPKDYPAHSSSCHPHIKNRVFGKTKPSSDSESSDTEEEEGDKERKKDSSRNEGRALSRAKTVKKSCSKPNVKKRCCGSRKCRRKGKMSVGGVKAASIEPNTTTINATATATTHPRSSFFKVGPTIQRSNFNSGKAPAPNNVRAVALSRRKSSWWNDQMQKDTPRCSGSGCRHYKARKSVFGEDDAFLRDLHH